MTPTKRPLPPLVALTDHELCAQQGRTVLDTVMAAIEGGLRGVIMRERHLDREERTKLGARLHDLLAPVDGVLIIASDPDLAVEVHAAGAHLAQDEPWVPGGSLTMGRSVHDHRELDQAIDQGFDYVTLSPVFASISKPGYGPGVGLDGLEAAAARPGSPPVFALGGVTPDNAGACLDAGAAGVAVLGAIMGAHDPTVVTRAILAALEPAR